MCAVCVFVVGPFSTDLQLRPHGPHQTCHSGQLRLNVLGLGLSRTGLSRTGPSRKKIGLTGTWPK